MFLELDAVRKSIVDLGLRFDPHALTPLEAGEVMRTCSQIEASVASIKALAAARLSEGMSWQQEGYRSPAHQLADQAGMSPSAAKRALETGRRMSNQPDVAHAALAGELSPEQAAAVSDGAATNELIEKAKQMSVPELHEEVARTKAASTDPEARRRVIYSKRSFRRWTDREGAFQAHLYGLPEDGAGVWRMLDPLRRRLNCLRRTDSSPNESGSARPRSNDSFEALDYDALVTLAQVAMGQDSQITFLDLLDLGLFPQLDLANLASIPSSEEPNPAGVAGVMPLVPGTEVPLQNEFFPAGRSATVVERRTDTSNPSGKERRVKRRKPKRVAGSPVRIMIRVDLDSLLRGYPIDGELCEVAGYGPIPVSAVENLLAADNTFVVGLLTKAEELVGVYHHRRRPNAHQRSALDFLYPACAAAGCTARAGLQYDHREDWAKTKFTVFDLLDRLCPHHHSLKTRKGWGLVEGRGKRPFVAPDDPRHPSRAGPA
jgi:hypothetical protein